MKKIRVPGASCYTNGNVFCRVRIREGDEHAAKALFSRLHGIGPVSPDACAFGEGVLTEGFACKNKGILLPKNSPWLAQQFETHCEAVTRFVGLRMDVQTVFDKVNGIAPWVMARFHICCRVCRIDRNTAQAMAQILGAENEALFASLSALPLGSRVVLAEKGEQVVGFMLLLFRFHKCRVATVWIDAAHRRTGVLTALVYCACQELRKRHIPSCDISMIDETNTASLSAAQSFGAVIDRRFALYHI